MDLREIIEVKYPDGIETDKQKYKFLKEFYFELHEILITGYDKNRDLSCYIEDAKFNAVNH